MALPAPGTKAPDFSLMNKDGAEVTLASLQGHWVALYFYPRDNTPGCTREAIDFSRLAMDFAAKEAVILGISPDSPKSHARFIEKQDLRIALLSDPDHKVCERYGVWQMKKMCGRESMGVVRSTFLINPQGVIEKSWEKVKVEGHADEVHQCLCDFSLR